MGDLLKSRGQMFAFFGVHDLLVGELRQLSRQFLRQRGRLHVDLNEEFEWGKNNEFEL